MIKLLFLVCFVILIGVGVGRTEKRDDGLIWLNEPRKQNPLANVQIYQEAYFGESGVTESGVTR